MAITYTWSVTEAPNYAMHEGHENVVYAVFWKATASDGDDEASDSGCIGLPLPTGKFTPFDKLTHDQVVGWAKAALGADEVARIEANLAEGLHLAAQPKPELPWAVGE